MSEARAKPRFALPLAVQIIALLVAVLIVGQLATLAVVMILPPPRPAVYRIEEIAAALKGEAVAPHYAPPLVRSIKHAPLKERSGRDFRAQGLKVDLARLLNVSVDDVRFVIEPRSRFRFPFIGGGGRGPRGGGRDRPMGMMEPPPDSPPDIAPPDAPPPYAGGGPPPHADGAMFWGRRGRQPWPAFRTGMALGRLGFVVGRVEAAYQTQPGVWTVVRSRAEGFPNAWERRLFLWFLACLALLTPVGYLFARRLTAPIRRFAKAADRLGRDPRAPPMALRGPAEIGLAAAAFNEMQARLARYVEDRTAMIGAIAHDLRTPLARVQFKLQRAPDEVAADIRKDLGQMEAMIAAVLAFVRDAAPGQHREPLDLLSLLEVVADDASATGADVEIEPGPAIGGQAMIVEADASALQRLFVNLVDNAVKYGGRARIQLRFDGGEGVVQIADDGPGLSKADMERVFEPFFRIETSRSRDTGGIGLGLSIARSIARAHGGDVALTSGVAGLTATVRLPLASDRRQ